MSHQYHFRSSIDPEKVDRRADELGLESRAEYIRYLIREDLQLGVADRE